MITWMTPIQRVAFTQPVCECDGCLKWLSYKWSVFFSHLIVFFLYTLVKSAVPMWEKPKPEQKMLERPVGCRPDWWEILPENKRL